MKKLPAKRRKLNSRIKDAEEDNHKTIQDEKKKRPKRRLKRMIKRLIRKNMGVRRSPRRIQIKNINLKLVISNL